MFIVLLSTVSSRSKPQLSLALTLLTRHLSSSSFSPSTSSPSPSPSSSKLYAHYCFQPPPSLHPVNQTPPTKPPKPPYRPPSSLDRSSIKTVRSDLPFDFRFSYTESSPSVRPIGLREPKYSPFGPGRLDREWTGVCAPARKLRVGIGDVDLEENKKLEEKRRRMRERLQGAELTNAERKCLVESCQRGRTKRQINLGSPLFFLPFCRFLRVIVNYFDDRVWLI